MEFLVCCLVLTFCSAHSRSEAITFGGIPMASSVASQMLTINGVQVSVGEALKQLGHVLGGDIVNVAPDGRCAASTIVAAFNVLTYLTTHRTEAGYAEITHDVQRERRMCGSGRFPDLFEGDPSLHCCTTCRERCPCPHFREAQVADRSVGETSVSQRKGPPPTCPVLAPTEPDDESAFTAVAAWVQQTHASEPIFRVSGECPSVLKTSEDANVRRAALVYQT